MTALWISLAVVLVLIAAWRLRRASALLSRILREERERTEQDAATPAAEEPEPIWKRVRNRHR
jgi:Sec-independent protein translocase protein TatA